MNGRKTFLLLVPGAVLAMSLWGCDAVKSSNPTSPSVAGPIAGVAITAPTPVTPAAGATFKVSEQPISLVINNSSTNGQRPITYIFEVASDAQFANRLLSREGIQPGTSGKTSLTLPDALAADHTYYWRAKADDGANSSGYSAAVNFDVITPVNIGVPQPLFPIGGVTTTTVQPTFGVLNSTRSGPFGAISYTFEISTNESFTSKAATVTVGEGNSQTQFALPSTLSNSTTYFWRVRAFDPTVTTAWSATQVFVTPAPIVTAPTPSPGGGGGGGNSGGHVTPGPLTTTQASNVIYATAAEFPGLTRVFSTDSEALAAADELLQRMIWHLQLYGFKAGRQQNPSGAISSDKLTIFIDGGWHAYDVFRLGYAGVASDVQFLEVFPANTVASSGIAD